ncbi:MAG: polymer-forming cytoskeletal protein [Planctomycetota bacterium]
MAETTRNKTVLGPDCKISGELSLDNDAVIMGSFQGTLRVSGTLELTDSASIKGTIIAGTLRLAGHAEADVVAEQACELLPGAALTGQLYTSRLNVVEGAVFQGDVCIGPKAIQAATEALGEAAAMLESAPAVPQAMPTFAPQMTEAPAMAEDDAAYEAAAAEVAAAQATGQPVHTMPQTVQEVLARRRAKVLAAQQSVTPRAA